jgi:8-oxo-dGTP pyrophosphatase MutT (NUDIX family)
MTVVRRSARGLLVEGDDLVLIKRTRPGQAPYLVTIGGGVEPHDASVEDALRREVWEEIGGTVDTVRRVFVVTDQVEGGTGVQHLFIARLVAMDLAARTGTEFAKTERGGYEVVRVPFDTYALTSLDTPLMPPAIASFLVANVEGLRDVLNAPAGKE